MHKKFPNFNLVFVSLKVKVTSISNTCESKFSLTKQMSCSETSTSCYETLLDNYRRLHEPMEVEEGVATYCQQGSTGAVYCAGSVKLAGECERRR